MAWEAGEGAEMVRGGGPHGRDSGAAWSPRPVGRSLGRWQRCTRAPLLHPSPSRPSAADLGRLEWSRTPTSPSSRAQRPRPEVSAAWVPLWAVKEARSTPQPGSRCFQEPLAVVGPSITASLPSCSLSFLPKCSSVPRSPVFIRTPGILDWGSTLPLGLHHNCLPLQ